MKTLLILSFNLSILNINFLSAQGTRYVQGIEIISTAENILKNGAWNHQDDRLCIDDISNKSYSLYCALHTAENKIKGKYQHRGLVMRSVRKFIKKRSSKRYKHPIRDYNNLKGTTIQDIYSLLKEVKLFLLKKKKSD